MANIPNFEPLPNIGNVVSNNVTAFNQGYNLYQCINYLQGYVSIAYDNMDALLADWNNFQQVVNEKITNIATEESQKVLNQWLEDGTLNDLVAQNPLWNQKLDKSGGTMTGPLKLGNNADIRLGNNADIRFENDDNILKKNGTDLVLGNNVLDAVIASSGKPVWMNGDSVKNEIALKSDIQSLITSINALNKTIQRCGFLTNAARLNEIKKNNENSISIHLEREETKHENDL